MKRYSLGDISCSISHSGRLPAKIISRLSSNLPLQMAHVGLHLAHCKACDLLLLAVSHRSWPIISCESLLPLPAFMQCLAKLLACLLARLPFEILENLAY